MSKKEVPKPAEDVYAGQGGSYVINPETGQRELAERTEAASANANNLKENEDGTVTA